MGKWPISDRILVGFNFFPYLWLFKYSRFKMNGGLKSSYFSLFQSKVVPQTCWLSVKQSWKHPWLLENNFPWPQMVLGLGIMGYRVVLHLEMWCINTDGIGHLLERRRINCSCIFCWSAPYLLCVILIDYSMILNLALLCYHNTVFLKNMLYSTHTVAQWCSDIVVLTLTLEIKEYLCSAVFFRPTSITY